MSKVAVVYWSGTGNTEEMALAVKEGAEKSGAEASLFTADSFSNEDLEQFVGIAFGCPSMGDEVLEETEFEPMFTRIKTSLTGKKVALFGSYGWGDGQWMREWEKDCLDSGINLAHPCVIANESPSEEELDACKTLGATL